MRMYEVRGPTGFKDDFEEPSCAAVTDVVMWSCWLLAVQSYMSRPPGRICAEKRASWKSSP
jgi:hypothetical protein